MSAPRRIAEVGGSADLRWSALDCAEPRAWIGKDPRLWGWFGHPWALLVGLDWERPAEVRATGTVVYCPQVDSAVHEWLMSRLH